MRKLIVIVVAFGVALTAVAQLKMTPETLWRMGRVSGLEVSPNGQQVLYGVTNFNVKDNSSTRHLYLVPVEEGTATKIIDEPGRAYDEQWHPSGEKIGFIANYGGEPQLYEWIKATGEINQVTFLPGGITHFEYAPSGDKIWYTAKVQRKSTVEKKYPDLPLAEARIIDDLMYRHWNTWDDFAVSHLFVANYSNGVITAPKDVMAGQPYSTPVEPFGGREQIAWRPDGKTLVYTVKELTGKEYALSTNTDLMAYDTERDTTVNLTEGMPGYDRNPVFSPSGQYMVWSSMARNGFESDRARLFLYDFTTRQQREISTGLNRDILHPAWSLDEETIYCISGDKGTYQIFEMRVKDGQIEAITDGPHDYRSVAVAGEKTLIGLRQDMTHPTELYKISLRKGETTQLTFTNQEILNVLPEVEMKSRWITTSDNKQMHAWVIYPPDFDPAKKYPTLLYCQGGPQATVSQFYSYRWNFQLMAAKGYIIVAPNRRGLPTFGREWNDQISGDWGGQAMQDYLSAIDAMKQEPYVDDNRLGAVGASFGGYSVYWLAGHHDNRFKAFIAHCGVFNLESWYGTTEELFFANWDLGGPYWEVENKADYEAFSPHRFVQHWDTPILVIHSEKDFRVPIGEGIQAFQAAQLQDIPSRFLYFPNEGHWILQPQNGILWHREFFDWLDKYLK